MTGVQTCALPIFDHALAQAQLVVAVEDLEAFGQLRVLPVQSQQPVRQAVEGADPQPARAVAQQFVGAMAHLAGGLVGEGHGEDAVHRHPEHTVQRSEEHTSELQSLMLSSYAVFCSKKRTDYKF